MKTYQITGTFLVPGTFTLEAEDFQEAYEQAQRITHVEGAEIDGSVIPNLQQVTAVCQINPNPVGTRSTRVPDISRNPQTAKGNKPARG